MRLVHYTAEPWSLDRAKVYAQEGDELFKPKGLWLSAETDDADSYGWADWCRDEEFRLGNLAHATEVTLAPGARVSHLSTEAQVLAFAARYRNPRARFRLEAIDWAAVARDCQGLLIAPYQWGLRLSEMWYYGWDCASACVWDLSALEAVRPLPRRALDLRADGGAT